MKAEYIILLVCIISPIVIALVCQYFRIHIRNKITKPKEKCCSNCGSDRLCLLRSQCKKVCIDCNHEMFWGLDKDQAPLVANNRMVKRESRTKTD